MTRARGRIYRMQYRGRVLSSCPQNAIFRNEPVFLPGDLPTGCTLCTLQCLRGFPRVQPKIPTCTRTPGTGSKNSYATVCYKTAIP
jgi:Fe-S-cluster-containing hydrogenase component 2